MKLWVDALPAPDSNYISARSVVLAKSYASALLYSGSLDLLDIGYDARSFKILGGNYVEVLYFLEKILNKNPKLKTSWNGKIKIHCENPAHYYELKSIIIKNHWKEITYMDGRIDDIRKNCCGANDPTAFAVLKKEDIADENFKLYCEMVRKFIDSEYSPRKFGVGELIFKTREQYIEDCIEALKYEFMIDVTKEDIEKLCKCQTEKSINECKRRILNRM